MTNGLVVMTPSSIAYSGTSASINADGSVVFSACTSLSLNGVFTGDYDNYMVTVRVTDSGSSNHYFRLRNAGSDNITANSYVRQYLLASNTSVSSARITSNYGAFAPTENGITNGYTAYLFGPYLSQPTATRSTSVSRTATLLTDWACTHSVSNLFDGLTILTDSSLTMTGLLTVFGFNQ